MYATSAIGTTPIRRRRFLQTAMGAMAGAVLPAWALSSPRASGSNGTDQPAATPATKALAAKYGRWMKRKGLYRQAGTGLVYPSSYRGTLYDWDLYFDSLALLYCGLHQPAIGGIKMFLRSQREDGFICRRIVADPAMAKSGWGPLENEEHCKPFLCQLALLVCRASGDASWLSADDLGRLDRYLDHWVRVCDIDRDGLSEWNSAPHSGADTQLKRVGTWRSRFCQGVDINCYLCVECLAGSELAKALGKQEMAARLA